MLGDGGPAGEGAARREVVIFYVNGATGTGAQDMGMGTIFVAPKKYQTLS